MTDAWQKLQTVFRPDDGSHPFDLPIRWGDGDFYAEADGLFTRYQAAVRRQFPSRKAENAAFQAQLARVCELVLEALGESLHGLPARAYARVKELMGLLEQSPLYASHAELEPSAMMTGPVPLYRVVRVEENKVFPRKRIFHSPYSLRRRIATNRYSIAGFPSLYLATTVELADLENGLFSHRQPAIAARFSLNTVYIRAIEQSIRIMDLSWTPQALADPGSAEKIKENRKRFEDLVDASDRISGSSAKGHAPERYLLRYPLLAACSYIRVKREGFAPEYILPQLLTQWLRQELDAELVGIKYFSCFTEHAADIGANYCFPATGDTILRDKGGEESYCPVLNEAFLLSEPVFLPNYGSENAVQDALDRLYDLGRLDHAVTPSRTALKAEKSVILPKGMKYLSAMALKNCMELKTVTLCKGLAVIRASAFEGCSQLKSLRLPDSLRRIEKHSFDSCRSLEGLEIPSGVEWVGEMAFRYCDALKRVTIQDAKTVIGRSAFLDCVSLEQVSLGKGVREIGDYAFRGCTELKALRIPASVEKIGAHAFDGCPKLNLDLDPANPNFVLKGGTLRTNSGDLIWTAPTAAASGVPVP